MMDDHHTISANKYGKLKGTKYKKKRSSNYPVKKKYIVTKIETLMYTLSFCLPTTRLESYKLLPITK